MRRKRVFLFSVLFLSFVMLSACDSSNNSNSDEITTTDALTGTDVVDPNITTEDISKEGYTLIFNDEFSGSSLDEEIWNFEINGDGGGNNELQYYRRENLKVKDGLMTITAKKENYLGKQYTSSRITTQGNFDFEHGYIETKMALPNVSGLWPAFWMLGSNYRTAGWPKCGEIDIMEAINAESKIYSTCHWGAAWNQHANYGLPSKVFDTKEFHVYACEWTETMIKTYVDGEQVYAISINSSLSQYFNHNFFLIYNLAVGGQWPGYNIGTLPSSMQVDYVRVYQVD